jgi:hypothetical protein
MIAEVKGEVLGSGQVVFDGKQYPYFELLQRGDGKKSKSEIVRVSGTGVDTGKVVSVQVSITFFDGKMRVKKLA